MLNEFHPVALACPLLLYAIWYLDEDRLLPFAVFAVLACLTKEEVPLVVAGLGVWYGISRRRWRAGGAIAVVGVATALLVIQVVIPHFNPQGHSSFYGRYREVGGSPAGVVRTLFTHPLRLARHAFTGHNLGYLVRLLLPLAGLWIFAPLILVALLPELAANLLSATHTQASIHFHYTAAEIPPLVAASVLGAAQIVRRPSPRGCGEPQRGHRRETPDHGSDHSTSRRSLPVTMRTTPRRHPRARKKETGRLIPELQALTPRGDRRCG